MDSWTDPRIRSRHKSDFVHKFDNFKANPRALSLKKYNETLQQMGGFGQTCHVQSVYSVDKQRDNDGKIVLRLTELKSQKTVIPLEDVFDVVERIHIQHNHICNIAKFYRVLQDETNFATGNISFEMVKDFIVRCQTCTLNSQQKNQPIQNNALFAPPLHLPTTTNNQISPLSNGISKSSELDPRLRNGSAHKTKNVLVPAQSVSAVPSPVVFTPVCQPSCPTPLPNPGFSLNSTTQNFNITSNWMPTFTSTPLATKSALPRIEMNSSFEFSQSINSTNNRVLATPVPNKNDFAAREAPTREPSDVVKQIQVNVKKELQAVEDILQTCINNEVNEFIINDSECRKILADLASNHFAMWELKESKSNPGDFYFFNKKTGKCQWNEPDEWLTEIKKQVSQEKILQIEEASKEDPLDESEVFEEEDEEGGDIDNSPIERQDLIQQKEIVPSSVEQIEGLSDKGTDNEHDNNNNNNIIYTSEHVSPTEKCLNEPICSTTTELNGQNNNESAFLRPFNSTSSFMAMAALEEGQIEDETMDIVNFIEQFENDLEPSVNSENENIAPASTSLNVPVCSTTEDEAQMRKLTNEMKVTEEEVKNKEVQLPKRTAKKSIVCAKSSSHYVATNRKRLDEALNNKKVAKDEHSNKKRPPLFKHLPLNRFRVFLPNIDNLLSGPQMDVHQLKASIKELEVKIKTSKGKRIFSKSFPPAKKKRSSIAAKNNKNVASCSTKPQVNKRSSVSKNTRRSGTKRIKKESSVSDFAFPQFSGQRRSRTPMIGKNVQLYFCLHCPAGANQKYTSADDYKMHIVARHRIVIDDCKCIRDYLKKQRYIENLTFLCEDCDIFFDQISAFQRATKWILHRTEKHGLKECKENCATIIGKISESPTHHPFLTIKKEEPLSDNEEDTDLEAIKDITFNPTKKNTKKKKKRGNKASNSAASVLKKEVVIE